MTLDERALAHGRAALASPNAEEWLGTVWLGIPRVTHAHRFLISSLEVGYSFDPDGDGTSALDLACVMYAQDVAEGRHT